jgi:polyisoprenoid-binding protein YceI
MKKIFILALSLAMMATTSFAQKKYFTRNGKVSFYSKAPLENIEAHNKSASSVIDGATGKMEMAVLIKGFEFEKALMQEHFNENYMESSKYPKAVFKGQIKDASKVNFTKDGTYNVNVAGVMDLHGVKKDMTATGTITVKSGAVSARSEFNILLEDFKIKIPGVVKDKVSKSVKIVVDGAYTTL